MKVIDSNVWGCSAGASITSAYNAAPTNSQIVYIICGLVGARLHMLVFEHVRVTNFNAPGMCYAWCGCILVFSLEMGLMRIRKNCAINRKACPFVK